MTLDPESVPPKPPASDLGAALRRLATEDPQALEELYNRESDSLFALAHSRVLP